MVAGIHHRLIAGGHGAAEPGRKIGGFGRAARGQDKLVPALLRASRIARARRSGDSGRSVIFTPRPASAAATALPSFCLLT
jgi:hypothetical protein